MTAPCIVLIAAADALPTLKERAAAEGGELLAFADADALRALEAITRRRPAVVALERLFAATPRGAALVTRIKADPTLTQSEIRVVSLDADASRPDSDAAVEFAAAAAGPEAPAEPTAPAEPLDDHGTRRAPRRPMSSSLDVMVDGNPAVLVDLSMVGAQVISPTVLRPNQRVRLSLPEGEGALRVSGTIAWATFEIPTGSSPCYRAGIAFINPDRAALEAYGARHATREDQPVLRGGSGL